MRTSTSVGSNPAGKITSIVAGMVAGADCIDDPGVIRTGYTLCGPTYAPSTLGSFLQEFTIAEDAGRRSATRKRSGTTKANAGSLMPNRQNLLQYPARLSVDDRAALAVIAFVLKTWITWRELSREIVSCSGVAAGMAADHVRCWMAVRSGLPGMTGRMHRARQPDTPGIWEVWA